MDLERNLAMKLAEAYHGRPVSPDYVYGEATGGKVFVDQARMAMSVMRQHGWAKVR